MPEVVAAAESAKGLPARGQVLPVPVGGGVGAAGGAGEGGGGVSEEGSKEMLVSVLEVARALVARPRKRLLRRLNNVISFLLNAGASTPRGALKGCASGGRAARLPWGAS